MWSSLMIITGVGAAVGNIFFVEVPPFVFALTEGIAAGAMLTMIAQTSVTRSLFQRRFYHRICSLVGIPVSHLLKILRSLTLTYKHYLN